MCSSTGSERLSAASPQGAEVAARSVLGENAQNQMNEALSQPTGLTQMDNFQGIPSRFRLEGRANTGFVPTQNVVW